MSVGVFVDAFHVPAYPKPTPGAPCGIPKLNTAVVELPLLFTVAFDPYASVVVVPIVTLVYGPAGIAKLNTAAFELPLLLTVAFDPAAKVVVVPTEIVGLLGSPKLKIEA